MLNTWKDLSEKIAEILAPSDAEVLSSELASISRRREALAKVREEIDSKISYSFKNKDPQKPISIEEAYFRYFEAVGGKTWFTLLRERNDAELSDYLTKNHERAIRARNEKFAFKLEKEGIVSIEAGEQISEGRRFYGTWILETNFGRRLLSLEMILAGGYNIQCLHNRTLLKIKGSKK